jgi:uncharacterized protein involved in propanediol utilization
MIGAGYAEAHHGEILQGVFRDTAGLKRALVTLRCPTLISQATFYPSYECPEITVPPGMWKVHNAAVSSMAAFSTERSRAVGGSVSIASTVPRGIGMGSSTADVTATIRAVASFHGVTPSAEEIAKVAVQAELASDPIMIDDRLVLFAHRDGVVLETFGRRFPPMVVVGCDADPNTGGIDTVTLRPPVYTVDDIDTFRHLQAELRAAVASGDVARLGRVATASALISQRFLAKPAFEFLLDTCQRCGGCGVQVAHSGTVAGIIFDPSQAGAAARIERCLDRISAAGLPLTSIINTGTSAARAPRDARSWGRDCSRRPGTTVPSASLAYSLPLPRVER